MRRTIQRALLTSGSAVIGLLVAYGIWGRRGEPPTVELTDTRSDVEELLVERSRSAPARPAVPVEGQLVREPVPEDQAARMFPTLRNFPERFTYDPRTYYWAKPNVERRVWFSEHLSGNFEANTNDLGFRKSADVLVEKPDLRILVTGDSHTEGVVPEEELFTEVLQELLESEPSIGSVEVLNGGKGGFSFYHYLGVLEKFLSLEPDVFIVAVYGGNDFLEAARLARYFHRLPPGPKRPPGWNALIADTAERNPGLFAQFLNQILVFESNAEELSLARETAKRVTRAIHESCRKNGVELIYAYLPPLYDVQPEKLRPMIEGVAEGFGLEPRDLSSTDSLAEQLLWYLKQRRIPHVDLRESFRGLDETLYWQTDHHLSTGGHEKLAKALAPLVRALAARSPGAPGEEATWPGYVRLPLAPHSRPATELGPPVAELVVHRDGRILGGGRELFDPEVAELGALRHVLAETAEEIRRDPAGLVSADIGLADGLLLIRADDAAPFRYVQHLLVECGAYPAYIARIHLATRRRTTGSPSVGEGRLDVSLPISDDRDEDPSGAGPEPLELEILVLEPGRRLTPPNGEPWSGEEDEPWYHDPANRRLQYRIGPFETVSYPALAEHLEALAKTAERDGVPRQLVIDPGAGAIVGDVARVLDALVAAEHLEIAFAAPD